ncbi:LysR family transcriptional regulator [Paludibacterium purpuratum]|uniref:DNA-binding transcriptional LysR family regulator n=1 Tax=Paludibacterium purpuratum TaxID=1144873 RepID=A0A4R7BDA1_9NEIS|nr:LysR family transcriptional regulator [Paludibacterium purpuratum]TDR82703.1 DNA-binding transcriptional LysR family regulator [Paludibacterium purpuratum]
MMNLTHWQLLVAVADLANITRAAERVGMTQSGASQAIAQMEAHLGMPLFRRERRHVAVTELGEHIIAQARDMLGAWEAIRAFADENQGLGHGRIRLASFPSAFSHVLPDLLGPFRRRHPGIELVMLEGSDVEVESWLEDGTAEVGVMLNPPPERSPIMLGRSEWVVLVPNAHPLARRSRQQGVSWAELADEPFIAATGGCRNNALSLSAQAGVFLNQIRVTVHDWASAAVLVKEGLGVAVLPESTVPVDLAGVRMLALQPGIFRSYGLVQAPAAVGAKPVQALFSMLRGTFNAATSTAPRA